MNRIVIVGASAGGLATAEALRRAGYQGVVTLVGDEPYFPYDRPPLSKHFLKGEWQSDRIFLRPRADIDALDLELRLGVAATGLDLSGHRVELADGAQVPYDGLVVATGVRPRRLPGSEGVTGLHVLRTLEDALALRARLGPGRRLVIVGGGFVGAEAAATARELGAEVTLLEGGPVPLGQAVGTEAGRFLAGIHLGCGVQIHTGVMVREILSEQGRVTGVRLAGGTILAADEVLVAIGSLPNTEWLEGSGLTVLDGLLCDEYSAAAPGVYGVGDVARWHNPLFGMTMRVEHRTNAGEQALAATRNLMFPNRRQPFAPVPYFWSDQYDTRVQAYGHLRDHDEAAVVVSEASERLLVAYRGGDRLAGVLAVGISPKTLLTWRGLIVARASWATALAGAAAA